MNNPLNHIKTKVRPITDNIILILDFLLYIMILNSNN